MKITLTGSLGNIGKPLATALIQAGHQVTIISSDATKAAVISALAGIPAIGSIMDEDFLVSAFSNAEVVYTMIPPDHNNADYRGYSAAIGEHYATAIRKAGVGRVVNLSSMGAHLSHGTGPGVGAWEVEQALNTLTDVAITHVRIPYIYNNLYGNIPMIINAGAFMANYDEHTRLVLVHPEDIATALTQTIQAPFTGHQVQYVASDDRTAGEVAAVIGAAISRPDLKWIGLSDEQALGGIMQSGIREEFAHLLVEVGISLRNGIQFEDFDVQGRKVSGSRKLESFAQEFAEKFNRG